MNPVAYYTKIPSLKFDPNLNVSMLKENVAYFNFRISVTLWGKQGIMRILDAFIPHKTSKPDIKLYLIFCVQFYWVLLKTGINMCTENEGKRFQLANKQRGIWFCLSS